MNPPALNADRNRSELELMRKEKGKSVHVPRSTEFSLDLITLEPPEQWKVRMRKGDKVFTTPTHRRQPSVVFRNLTEIYTFEIDEFYEDVDQEFDWDFQQKRDTFLSHGRKSTLASDKKELRGNQVSQSIECDEMETVFVQTKSDENLETVICNTQEELIDVGSLPMALYCNKCKSVVQANILAAPSIDSIWRFICCFSPFYQQSSRSKSSEEIYSCSRCGNRLSCS
jgi:hypothetical protein